MRLALPSPYEELAHTADVGIRVTGASREEAMARAALAMAQLQAGGGPVDARVERPLRARGEDAAATLVDLCRQVLGVGYAERLLLGAIEVAAATDTEAWARGWFGPFDPVLHGEGTDIKAVTYARARLAETSPGTWEAVLVFDV